MGATIKQLLTEAAFYLRSKGLSSPRLEAEVLLSFLWKKDRSFFYGHGDEEVEDGREKEFWALIRRRGEGVPAAYIMGQKEFMGLNFYLEEGVFIPRPETEHLVETVIHWIKSNYYQRGKGEDVKILELGCGCGNVSISLAYYLPEVQVVAVELEDKPIKMARINSKRMGVADRVKFLQGSFFKPLADKAYKYNAIVSNPPYILQEEMPLLSSEVQHEPVSALNGGINGLYAYKEIFTKVRDFLSTEGLLALEIEEEQLDELLMMGEKYGFSRVEVRKDYAGRDRVVALEKRELSRPVH